jgi:hypothetical protein
MAMLHTVMFVASIPKDNRMWEQFTTYAETKLARYSKSAARLAETCGC